MRTLIATLTALAALCAGVPALASSDMSCEPTFKPASARYSDCDSTALLAPGNDTRVNLALLMMDAHGGRQANAGPAQDEAQRPQPSVPFRWADVHLRFIAPPATRETEGQAWASGEGTTCVSNDLGQAGFIEALQAERALSGDERERLAAARRALVCPPGEGAAAQGEVTVTSEAGRAFAAYLRAAAAFYAGEHAPAPFDALASNRQPWVREAARYMVGRNWALVALREGFGEYGDLRHDRMDRGALAKAESALKAYLKTYPRGRYAASAHGLLRRVHWLGQDQAALAVAYGWQIDQQDATLRNVHEVDLAQEIDVKLDPEAYRAKTAHPVLVAVDALRRMRQSGDAGGASITRGEIEALRPRFKGREALHGYLLAAHAFFVDAAPGRVLELIPADTASRPFDTLAFSRQALRALALDATGDKDARAALVALFPRATSPYQRGTLEIALAMHDERAGQLARVFAADSLVVDPALRERLLVHAAGPELLRARADDPTARARERAVALYVLLYKQLTRGRYAGFVADAKRLPARIDAEGARYDKLDDMTALADFRWQGTREGFACPSLQQTASALAANSKAYRAGLCMGEFMRLNGYDRAGLESVPGRDELGGAPTQFPGAYVPRQVFYQRVIADAAAPAEDRAYALYRAVYCYAPAGYNDCGGEDVPVATRKAWHDQLKSRYPQSPWAKQLRYYW